MRLKNKVAIITGGGTGIGRGIALEFAKQGACVAICGRHKEQLDDVAHEITLNGGSSIGYVADVSSEEQIKDMVDSVISHFGTVDILINNAGIYLPHEVLYTSENEWDATFCIDIKGIFLTSKKILSEMIKHEYGKIVNIASIAGVVGFEKSAAYCAAKGAVMSLTRQMALDYAREKITINAIAPGVIFTNMTKDSLSSKEATDAILRKIPIGRIGTSQDIANAALFLASNESSYITGQTLVVDGGWTIQ